MDRVECIYGGKCCFRSEDGECDVLSDVTFPDGECHFRKTHRKGVNEYDFKHNNAKVKKFPLKPVTKALPNGKEYVFLSHPYGCLFCKHLRDPYITNGREYKLKCKVGDLEDGVIGRCAWFERRK